MPIINIQNISILDLFFGSNIFSGLIEPLNGSVKQVDRFCVITWWNRFVIRYCCSNSNAFIIIIQ